MKSLTDSWIPTFTFFQYKYEFRGAMPGISMTYQMISEDFVFEDVNFFLIFDLAQISGPSRVPGLGRCLSVSVTRAHVGLGQKKCFVDSAIWDFGYNLQFN